MEIVPFTTVGILEFGQSRIGVREKLAAPFTTFRKGPFAQNDTDAFDDLGLHLYYTSNNELEFVEAFDPAIVSFRGITLLGRDMQEIVEDMKSCGFNVTESDNCGVTFGEAGIALFGPSGTVEGVAAFRKGYYDR